MSHLPELIRDLALILIVGAFVTLLFKKLRQPLVLGYILAGFLVGPHLSLIPTVTDTSNVETLAEIGVIFLLFALGLEFSVKKLMRVGGAASVTALVEIVFITLAGFITGRLLGWSTMDSMFLGGMLASSSTTIIIRAFEELGVKAKHFTSIVVGVLIVEDIVVILLMVLLSTVAVTREFEGTGLLLTIARLLFFLILLFVTGIYLVPTLLKKGKKLLDEETLLILAIGLCLGMVVLATKAGFSAELGAFLMGTILAESTLAEKIEHLFKPVKNLFGAIFFVSIGMLIDPRTIVEYKWEVMGVTLLTILGKLVSTTSGALISGQTLKQSVQVGMSMAQIGEFAFIVATLGLSLGVISDFLFPVAVGASAITTFITPYMIRNADGLYEWIETKLPPRWIKALNLYSSSTQTIQTEVSWKPVLKSYLSLVIVNSILLLTLVFLSINFLHPFLGKYLVSQALQRGLTLIITLAVISPFLWGLMAKPPDKMAYRELWLNKNYNHGPLLTMEFLRVMTGILLIGFLVNQLYSTLTALLIGVPLIFVVLTIFSNRIQKFYHRLELRFLNNLNAREIYATSAGTKTGSRTEISSSIPGFNLAPWDAHLAELEVPQQAAYLGRTLQELSWREKYGINIAYIRRGEKILYAPTRSDKLFPFDRVGLIATDEQMQAFFPVFEGAETTVSDEQVIEEIAIQNILVSEHNKLTGKTIKDSRVREKTRGLVIGIERDNERILNPVSSTVFRRGDIVWIVGDKDMINKLKETPPDLLDSADLPDTAGKW